MSTSRSLRWTGVTGLLLSLSPACKSKPATADAPRPAATLGGLVYEVKYDGNVVTLAPHSVYSSPSLDDKGTESFAVTNLETNQYLAGFDISPDIPPGAKHVLMSILSTRMDGSTLPTGVNLWMKDLGQPPDAGISQVTEGAFYDLCPRYSTDGNYAYFTSTRSAGNGLFRKGLSHNEVGLKFLSTEGECVRAPDVDSEGKSLIFATYSWKDDESYLWTMPEPGGLRKQLGKGAQGRWSRDGNQIVCSIKDTSSDVNKLWLMDSQGGDRRRLTSGPSNDVDPAWSPLGTRIVFASDRALSEEGTAHNNYDIFVIEADGSGLRQLTSNPSRDDSPRWLDDHTILFRSNRGQCWNVWRLQVD